MRKDGTPFGDRNYAYEGWHSWLRLVTMRHSPRSRPESCVDLEGEDWRGRSASHWPEVEAGESAGNDAWKHQPGEPVGLAGARPRHRSREGLC